MKRNAILSAPRTDIIQPQRSSFPGQAKELFVGLPSIALLAEDGKEKALSKYCEKALKFNFISLSCTFF
jgi:hypothetical protein